MSIFNQRAPWAAVFFILLAAPSSGASTSPAAVAEAAPAPAPAEKAETTGFSDYKELAQLRLETTRDLLQKDIQAVSLRVDTQDKRVDTQNSHIDQGLSLLGIVLSILGIVLPLAGLAGYFSVARKARSEAQKEARREANITADEWFQTHASTLQERLDALQLKLQQLEGEAELDFNLQRQRVQDRADLAIKDMQRSVTEPTETKPVISEVAATALSEAVIAAKNKPETAYKFSDWNNLAFDAFSKEEKDRAVYLWRNAANDDSATTDESILALLNAAAVLTGLRRYEEAIATYDELIHRFDESTTEHSKISVATALNQKVGCLNLLKRYDEALSLNDANIDKFKKDQKLANGEPMARALLNKVVGLSASDQKEEALNVCQHFIQKFDQNQNPEIIKFYIILLGRKIALLWDLGRWEESNETFERTLERFDNNATPNIRVELGRLRNTMGFKLLCQAKAGWNDIEARTKYLNQAESIFDQALTSAPQNAMILGNQAYCGYLLDRPLDLIRGKLIQALKTGGLWLYNETLGDLLIAPIPEKDDSFRLLLDETWESISKSS